jgi:glucokinase
MSYYLGIDIGGTTIRTAVATRGTDRLATTEVPTPQDSDERTVTEAILDSVEQVCAGVGIAPEEITAAGIGSVGPLDRDAGTVTGPANIAGGSIQLVDPLRELLTTDAVVLYNDATCGVIAERHVAESATENVVYLTFSTGIGAGIVADGNVIHGNAGEVGHMTVDPAGTMTCGCGLDGHWEAYCGGANIPDYARDLAREESVDTDLPVGGAFTAKDVFERAGEDDLAALAVERIGDWNTIGVANLVQAYAPTHIAVGGAVARNNPDAVLNPIRERLPEHAFTHVPEIRLAECGGDIVLTGALLAAQDHTEASA